MTTPTPATGTAPRPPAVLDDLADQVYAVYADHIDGETFHAGGSYYNTQNRSEEGDPAVYLVRRSDGKRFLVDVDVRVTEVPADGTPAPTGDQRIEEIEADRDRLAAQVRLVEAVAERLDGLDDPDREDAAAAATRAAAAWIRAALSPVPAGAYPEDALPARLAGILTGTANALKGPPADLHWHDWSDLPQVAADRMAELADVRERADHYEAVYRELLRQYGAALAAARRATPDAMGGTPDMFAPDCPEHGRDCGDPWDCHGVTVAAMAEGPQ